MKSYVVGDMVQYYGVLKKFHGMVGVVETIEDPGNGVWYNVRLKNGRLRRGCAIDDLVPLKVEIKWEV